MNTAILAPAAILVFWSLLVLMWMAATRFPALKKAGIEVTDQPQGSRGQDLESQLPPPVNWKSHNYTHLMEQPTLFYAIVVILAVAEAGSGLNLWLAWAYAILRIIHSIWQSTVNLVNVRFSLFLAASLCLLVMTINALWATLFLNF